MANPFGHFVHGMSGTKIHGIWRAMLDRCQNPRCADFKNYGARGIAVCARWRKFENFFADMGHRPRARFLDRKNNDGPYTPRNCRWATRAQHMANRRPWWTARTRHKGKFAKEVGT